MFTAGDIIVYGGEGVCRVESIGPSRIHGADPGKLYYCLTPLWRSGQVLTPVDTGILMRPVWRREEAQALVEDIAALPAMNLHPDLRSSKELYHATVMSYDGRETARLIRALHRKRVWMTAHNKRINQMDERYLKRAEEQLYGELAVALALPREEIPDYIRRYDPNWPEK